jgi:oxaloacetate decarboxylase (Na+ extruding) subunit alpha
MPALVDTTVRLLSQEPLAGTVPTASILELAEVLDGAGFAALEISGGGVFDSAVRRGVESPWERIRAIDGRTKTPLGMALRGRFLVGSRPVGGDFVRRFVMTAAENGISVFRLHDPLNDVSNLREAGEAITKADREFDAGLIYSPGPTGETDTLVEQAKKLPELGAARILLHDPSGSLEPHRSHELVSALAEASGLPVGIYCQGSGGSALAAALEAARAGADRIACATYPVALVLHRVSAEGLADALKGLSLDPDIDVSLLWKAAQLVDEHIGDEPVTPLAPRVAVRAAAHNLPAGLVAALDGHLRAQTAGDRLDEVLAELERIRAEAGWPPLAAPIGQILGSQALIHVLSANRYQVVVDELRALFRGDFGTPPAEFDPTAQRAVELLSDDTAEPPPAAHLDDVRDEARGLAASDEELLLLALFGDEAEALLHAVRGRARGDEGLAGTVEQSRAERIRELVRIVQESGVAEIAVEEAGMRVSVRRREDAEATAAAPTPAPATPTPAEVAPPPAAGEPSSDGLVRVEAPMVGTFYRAPSPGAPPFVEEGAPIAVGQTLCILEAMKLMNEIKAELDGVIRRIHVANGDPVEFGQLLFEIEPVLGRPLDAV